MTRARTIAVLLLVPSLVSGLVPDVRAQEAPPRVLVSPASAPDAETSALVTSTIVGVLERSRMQVVRGDTVIAPGALRILWNAMWDGDAAMAFASSVEDVGYDDVRLRLVLGRRDGRRPIHGDVVVPRGALPGAVRMLLPRLMGGRERAVRAHLARPRAVQPAAQARSSDWPLIAGLVFGGIALVATIVFVGVQVYESPRDPDCLFSESWLSWLC